MDNEQKSEQTEQAEQKTEQPTKTVKLATKTAQPEETQDHLNIVGDMAEKIKNNVNQQPTRFSWKLKFPNDIEVATIPETSVMLLNRNLKRLRCEFKNISAENAILISPHFPYKPNKEYFFWAKYKTKEICVAFVLSENNTMQTFDRKTSMSKLNVRHQKIAEKLAAEPPPPPPSTPEPDANDKNAKPDKAAKPAKNAKK
ncbi:MAG: hypothetical protein FWG64_08690 [Firmicutes bacterium]|nr:hypothetical protein [Bacillota bacterium]